jgi:hypothetical protein
LSLFFRLGGDWTIFKDFAGRCSGIGLFNASLMTTCFDANAGIKDRKYKVKPAFLSRVNSHFDAEDSNITVCRSTRRSRISPECGPRQLLARVLAKRGCNTRLLSPLAH